MTESEAPARTWSAENILVLLLMAALPVTFASGFTAYEVIKEGVLVAGGSLLLLLWTARAVRGQTLRLRGVLALLPVVGLVVLSLVSAVWAVNPTDALVASGRWVALLGVLLAVLDPLERPLPFSALAAAAAGGLGAASALGIAQGFGVVVDPAAPTLTADGLRGAFDNERLAALTVAAGLPLAAAGAFTGSLPARVISGLGLGLGAFYLGMVNVVDAWWALGGGVALAAGVIALGHGARGLLPSAGALAGLGAAGLVALGGVWAAPAAPTADPALPAELQGTELERERYAAEDVDWDRPEALSGELQREFAVETGLAAFSSAPLRGLGAGSYDAGAMGWAALGSPWYQGTTQSRSTLRSAHNTWVQLAAELGVFGVGLLALFGLVVLSVLWQALRRSAQASEEGQALPLLHIFGLAGALFAMGIGAAREELLGTAPWAALWMVASGAIVRESTLLIGDRGLARPWVLSREVSGAQVMERWTLAGLLPLAGAALALYLGGLMVVSNYYQARGDVWLRHGSLDRAEEAYDAALAVLPSNDIALFQRAQVLTAKRGDGRAEEALVAALQARPFDPRLLATLGGLQARLAIQRGRERLQASRGDVPKPPPPSAGQPPVDPNPLSAQVLLSFMDEESSAHAEANLKRALELHPRFSRAFLSLGNLYLTQKRNDEALAVLTRALEKEPTSAGRQRADIHIRIAHIHSTDEKWALAKEHTEKALAAFPGHPSRKNLLLELDELNARIAGKPVQRGHAHGSGPGLPHVGAGHGPGDGHDHGAPAPPSAPAPPASAGAL